MGADNQIVGLAIGSFRRCVRVVSQQSNRASVWLPALGLLAYCSVVNCGWVTVIPIGGLPGTKVSCSADSDCGLESYCDNPGTDLSACVPGCSTDTNCSFPHVCGSGFCIEPHCGQNAECPYGSVCEKDFTCGRPGCNTDSDCLSVIGLGVGCATDGYCNPTACASASNCPAGMACGDRGTCVPPS
jgi:hypothetical protein